MTDLSKISMSKLRVLIWAVVTINLINLKF